MLNTRKSSQCSTGWTKMPRNSVFDVTQGKGQAGADQVASADLITVREVQDKALVFLLLGELDEGEAEAITLSREISELRASTDAGVRRLKQT